MATYSLPLHDLGHGTEMAKTSCRQRSEALPPQSAATRCDVVWAHSGEGDLTESMQERIAQLDRWGLMIRKLSEQMLSAGATTRFDDLLDVDELKALHAIAQTKLDALRAATGPERSALDLEATGAWTDLAAAFERRRNHRHED